MQCSSERTGATYEIPNTRLMCTKGYKFSGPIADTFWLKSIFVVLCVLPFLSHLGSVASPLPSRCQPRAHPLQPDSAAAPPHPGSALVTPMRAAVGPFRRDRRRRAKGSRRGVGVARSLRTRGAPDGSRGLRPERWSKSPALVRAPGCFRIPRGRSHRGLYFTRVYTLGPE